MKFLLWAAIIVGVIWVLRNKKKTPRTESPASTRQSADGEPMFTCAHCGIHFPASEAVTDPGGIVFCGDRHCLQHRSR